MGRTQPAQELCGWYQRRLLIFAVPLRCNKMQSADATIESRLVPRSTLVTLVQFHPRWYPLQQSFKVDAQRDPGRARTAFATRTAAAMVGAGSRSVCSGPIAPRRSVALDKFVVFLDVAPLIRAWAD